MPGGRTSDPGAGHSPKLSPCGSVFHGTATKLWYILAVDEAPIAGASYVSLARPERSQTRGV